MVAHRCTGSVQLRNLLPGARRSRLPTAGRRRCSRRRSPAAARRRPVTIADRTATTSDSAHRRMCCSAGRCIGRDPPRCPSRPSRSLLGGCGQSVVCHRGGAHQTLSRSNQPGSRHRLATADGRSDPRAARSNRGGRTAVTHRRQHRRVRLLEPHRHGCRFRAVVQRNPPTARGGTAAARPRRADHRRGPRMGDPRPVAVSAATRRLRRHDHGRRLRRRPGYVGSVVA